MKTLFLNSVFVLGTLSAHAATVKVEDLKLDQEEHATKKLGPNGEMVLEDVFHEAGLAKEELLDGPLTTPVSTVPGSYPAQYTSSSYPSQYTSTDYPGQYTSSSYPSQYTSTSYPSQYTSTSYPSQYTSTDYPGQYTSTSYPSQYTSTSYPSQYTSTSYPSQYTTGSHPEPTTIPENQAAFENMLIQKARYESLPMPFLGE